MHKHHEDLDVSEIDSVIVESKKLGGFGLTPSERRVEDMTQGLENICILAYLATDTYPASLDQVEENGKGVCTEIKDLNQSFATMAAESQTASAHLLLTPQTDFAFLSWEHFHDAFSALDICRFTLGTINYLEGDEKIQAVIESDSLREELALFKEAVREVCKAVRQHAVEVRKGLQKPDTIQRMLQALINHSANPEDPIGKELQAMVDESWLNEIMEKLRRSWVEAINGIGDVKVF